jgi:hypothetical protein
VNVYSRSWRSRLGQDHVVAPTAPGSSPSMRSVIVRAAEEMVIVPDAAVP